MPIRINKSITTFNRGLFSVNPTPTLIGYVGTPTYFPNNNTITGQTCTTPIYTSGLQFGQMANSKIYYFDNKLQTPLTESSLMYPFSTISGGTTAFSFRMNNSNGGVGTNQSWGSLQPIGYFTISTTKVNVGNTNRFWSYSGDSGVYPGAFRYVSSVGSFPSVLNTYAWAPEPNVTAINLIKFPDNDYNITTLV